jgi:hypothetical protein
MEVLLCGVAVAALTMGPGEIQPKGHYAIDAVPIEGPAFSGTLDFSGGGDKIGARYALLQGTETLEGTLTYGGDLGDASYCFIRSDQFGQEEVHLAFTPDGASFVGKYYTQGVVEGRVSGHRLP